MKKSSILIALVSILSLGASSNYANGTLNDENKENTDPKSTIDLTTEPGLSYLKAKQAAELRHMKYVLYFKADWCSPCKWMQETTFQDHRFIEAVDNTFILVPLDIDAFEGYALKEYFRVFTLPTLLVFNENHEIVNRSEGSLSTNAFLSLLDQKAVASSGGTNEVRGEVINSRPQIIETHTSSSETLSIEKSGSELPKEIIESVSKYSIQLGAFSSYANAKTVQDKISQYTSEDVHITTIPNGDVAIYKVFAGKLNHNDQAEQLLKTLSSYGFDGFVTKLVVSLKS